MLYILSAWAFPLPSGARCGSLSMCDLAHWQPQKISAPVARACSYTLSYITNPDTALRCITVESPRRETETRSAEARGTRDWKRLSGGTWTGSKVRLRPAARIRHKPTSNLKHTVNHHNHSLFDEKHWIHRNPSRIFSIDSTSHSGKETVYKAQHSPESGRISFVWETKKNTSSFVPSLRIVIRKILFACPP